MRCIIEIDRIYSGPNLFGYIGIEHETGKIKYFSHFDNYGRYWKNQLFELNMDDPNTLKWYLNHCSYIREKYSLKLPRELQNSINILMEKHIKFNQENGYPISMLENNRKNLAIDYSRYLEFDDAFAAYVPGSNKIELGVTNKQWNELSPQKRKFHKLVLLHEIGHIKATKLSFDKKTGSLKIKTGFYNSIETFEPIQIENGEFYIYKKSKPAYGNGWEEALEEIMNSYECRRINPNYSDPYPNLGKQLDELCDGRLSHARYTNGIEEYYDSLTYIINSKDLADELLERIIDLDKSSEAEYENNKIKVMNIINKYNEEKTIKTR